MMDFTVRTYIPTVLDFDVGDEEMFRITLDSMSLSYTQDTYADSMLYVRD